MGYSSLINNSHTFCKMKWTKMRQELFERGNIVLAIFDLCVQLLSPVWLFVTPWNVARQDLLSMGFSRQEHWSGLPFPPLGDLPDPGIETKFPVLAGGFFTSESPRKSWVLYLSIYICYVPKCMINANFPYLKNQIPWMY